MTVRWLKRLYWLGTVQLLIIMTVAADDNEKRSLQFEVLGFYDSSIDTMQTSLEMNALPITERIRPVLKDRLEKERRPKKDISQLFIFGNKIHCNTNRDSVSLFDYYSQDEQECSSSKSSRGQGTTVRGRGNGKGKGGKSDRKSKGNKGKGILAHSKGKGKGGSKSKSNGSKSKGADAKSSKGRPTEIPAPTFFQTNTPIPTYTKSSKSSKGSPIRTTSPTFPETIGPTVAPSVTSATKSPSTAPAITSTPTEAPSLSQISAGPSTSAPSSGNDTVNPSIPTATTTAPSITDVTLPPSQNNATTVAPTSSIVAPTRDPASPTSSPVSLPGVPASPFSVQYDITGTPTDADFTQATDLTQQYLEDYFTQQFGLNVATIMTDFTGAVTGTDPATDTASYAVSVTFDDTSAFVPTTADLDLMLIAAFQQPFVQTLLDSLAGLPSSNPFATTTAANYLALSRRWLLL